MLSHDEIHKIYAFFPLEAIDPQMLRRYMQLLPADRKAKAMSFHKVVDQKTCVMSYLLLQYGLYHQFGICKPSLGIHATGKPYLIDYPHIHFNMSHCPMGCVCALSHVPVGIDIQDIRPFTRSVAEHCCADAELAYLNTVEDKSAEFTKIWAMKESYLKMKGTGIIYNLCTVDTTKLKDRISIYHQNGCYIALARADRFS